ncbi:hypothetical protein [Streptomyces sp. NPDC017993]|uniref:effector-associated constant component EACC1 n=1 Tax=Streptomyces sp. NPDC017993 TaxID=3365027 RepID=UPI003787C15B
MQVDIVMEGDSDGRALASTTSLTSLYRWLVQDPDVAEQADVSLGSEQAGAGEMGGTLEVINAVVANGIALGSLAIACATWRAARPTAPAVRIERDGVTVTVEDASPETVRRIVDALGEPQTPAGGPGTDQQQ